MPYLAKPVINSGSQLRAQSRMNVPSFKPIQAIQLKALVLWIENITQETSRKGAVSAEN